VVAVGALTFLDGTGAPQATATFDYEETPAGLRMTPNVISTTVTVQLNGRDVATFDPDSAGQSVLLPTAPGDRITVLSRDGEQSVLVQRTVDDRSEIGDFIAYYTFEDDDSPDTVVDHANNGNNATVYGSPDWNGGSMEFDGDGHDSGDWLEVDDLSSPEPVSEFTIAVAYKQETTDTTQNLVEHSFPGGEWALQTWPDDNCYEKCDTNTYGHQFRVGNEEVRPSERYTPGERRIVVGTYDNSSSNFDLYVNGAHTGGGNNDILVDMDRFLIGRNAGSPDEYFDGEIYEIRLYHTAFDGEEVEVITKAME